MKTAEEYLNEAAIELGYCGFNVISIEADIALKAMQNYHAAQLEAGIKAKALRKKGTDKYYVYDDVSDAWWESVNIKIALHGIDDNLEILKKYFGEIPADAELIDITIIIEKP